MECLTYNVKQTATVLGISPQAVYEMRNDGILKALPKVAGIRFSKLDVEALAGIGTGFNAYNYIQLQQQNKALEEENERLKGFIQEITTKLIVITNEVRG